MTSAAAMNQIRKITLALLIVGLVAGAGTFGVLSAFTATTSNTGNSLSSGTVALSDNDGGSTPLYLGSNKKPGDSTQSCIKVTYTGSLSASVKLYIDAMIYNGWLFNLKVERGTQTTGSFPGCGDFAVTSVAFDGDLESFPTTYGTALDGKDGGAAWATNDSVAYRFTITVNDDPAPNQHIVPAETGEHLIGWEARNN